MRMVSAASMAWATASALNGLTPIAPRRAERRQAPDELRHDDGTVPLLIAPRPGGNNLKTEIYLFCLSM
jgi:hypothetical protein